MFLDSRDDKLLERFPRCAADAFDDGALKAAETLQRAVEVDVRGMEETKVGHGRAASAQPASLEDAGGGFAPRELPRRGEAGLEQGRIEVWSVTLDVPAAQTAALEAVLSQDERARAERFRFERGRRRFIAARGLLRRLLGAYLDRAPADVAFTYGRKGKPLTAGLHFNLSHSGERVLIALGRIPLGVDIERLRPLRDPEAIARRFFSRAERETLAAQPAERKIEAFFACWTCKEAYVKAVGDGLAISLRSFDATFGEGRPPALKTHLPEGECERWFLRRLEPAPGYVGALAARDFAGTVTAWSLAGPFFEDSTGVCSMRRS